MGFQLIMSASIPYVDIPIFAIIAIFLGLRLRSVLGKRTGFESDESRSEMVEAISNRSIKPNKASLTGTGSMPSFRQMPFQRKGIRQGCRDGLWHDPRSFAEGDIEAPKPLLGYEMMNSFTMRSSWLKAGESSQYRSHQSGLVSCSSGQTH